MSFDRPRDVGDSTDNEAAPTRWDLMRRVPQDEAARQVQRHTRHRWVVWYGHSTGRYWAMPRPCGAVQPTIREFVSSATIDQLWSAMTAVDPYRTRERP